MSAATTERGSLGRWTTPEPQEHADMLSLVATSWQPRGRDVHKNFLSACEADATAHAGLVSVMRVRDLLAPLHIEHHQFSALWSHYTGTGRPMRRTGRLEACHGSTSRNNGKPYAVRRWVG